MGCSAIESDGEDLDVEAKYIFRIRNEMQKRSQASPKTADGAIASPAHADSRHTPANGADLFFLNCHYKEIISVDLVIV